VVGRAQRSAAQVPALTVLLSAEVAIGSPVVPANTRLVHIVALGDSK